MILIFLGAPGTGKGTISLELTKRHHFKHISTGDLFRKLSSSNSELSIKIKNLLNAGNLIDDETTGELLLSNLSKIDVLKTNIILDGYPRNLKQLDYLQKYFISINFTNFKIFYFNISEDQIIKRLSNRMICPKCGTIYNAEFHKPKIEFICDLDKNKLIVRKDDSEIAIKKRLKIYNEVTYPMIKYCRKNNSLIELNVENTVDQIVKEIISYV